MSEKYNSKKDIYQDYPLAVKFVLKPVPTSAVDYFKKDNYKTVRNLLSAMLSAQITTMDKYIENFEFKYPLSTAFFAEFPIIDEKDTPLGIKTLFLEHESGPEIFLTLENLQPFIAAAGMAGAGWTGAKVSDKLFDALWSKLTSTLNQIWRQNFPEAPQIVYVEFRTSDKGVMRMLFDDFHVSQLNCLLGKFHQIAHLSQVNGVCFQGKLFDPPAPDKDISTEARLAGKPPPLQACDGPEPL